MLARDRQLDPVSNYLPAFPDDESWQQFLTTTVASRLPSEPAAIQYKVQMLEKIASEPEAQRISVFAEGGSPAGLSAFTTKLLCHNLTADPGTVPIITIYFMHPVLGGCPSTAQIDAYLPLFERRVNVVVQATGSQSVVFGEAIALQREDVDLEAGVITIRTAKHDRARLVPLHPTAAEALRRYTSERDRLCPTPRSRAFLLSSAGTPVLAVGLRQTFREIMTRIGVRTEEVHPRIHDLRHRFAVQTLIDWQRSDVNIDEHIATLSTYLGHVSPADTYWYLSATPELMALAAERAADRFGGVR